MVMPNFFSTSSLDVNVAKQHELPIRPRGAGTFLVLALHTLLAKPVAIPKGVIIDFGKMKNLELNMDNYAARIQPGVTAFELQKSAQNWEGDFLHHNP